MIDDFWKREFGESPKIAHLLRSSFAARWVRFHSFSDCQRYPNDDAELQSALDRHNTILSSLSNPDSQLYILTTSYSPDVSDATPDKLVLETGLNAELWCSEPMHEIQSDSEPNYWHIFRSSIKWNLHAADGLLKLVVNDRIGNVMILDPTKSWLDHPYDGGADVIHESTSKRDMLGRSHESWLSPRSDGM